MSHRFSLSAWFAALSVMAFSMMATPAQAEGVGSVSCSHGGSYGGGGFSCVRTYRKGRFDPHVIQVRAPQTDEETAAIQARDRRWVDRCRPVIQQDRYGMPRYNYAAPGCEYGRLD